MIYLAIYPNFIQLSSLVHLVIWFFIGINGLAIVFGYLLATVFYLLSVSRVFSAIVFNFWSAVVSYFLSLLPTLSGRAFIFLSADMSSIRLFRLY